MKDAPYKSIVNTSVLEVLAAEPHHKHAIVVNDEEQYFWAENYDVVRAVEKIGLNNLIDLLYKMGLTKNSEVMRKLFRDMGYSLFGYWEIFHWEMNNPDAKEYVPNNSWQ